MVLCCDLQPAILHGLGESDRGDNLVRRTNTFLERAREDSGNLIGFVRVAFRTGHPEVHPNNELFSMIKSAGVLTEGSDGAALHPELVTKDDPVFTKRRVGAFSTTDLGTFLRGAQVEELVVFGVATGAVINSTVQAALDQDMKVTVLSDLCDDSIQSRHDALIKHVFPNQAGVSVCTGGEWLNTCGATREHPGIVTSALPK